MRASLRRKQTWGVNLVHGIIANIRIQVNPAVVADRVGLQEPADVSLARIVIWQSSANAVIFGLENVLTAWLAIGFVMDGGFSVGMVFAFVAYKTQLLIRAVSLIDQGIAFKMLGLHLERLSDIALADQDKCFAQAEPPRAEFKGKIELRDIRFRYGPHEPLILDGVNLLVEPGDHIAITGPSGGGKSTLLKIMLGLSEPESGEVLIDGIPLRQFGFGNFRQQIGAVLQDDHLFAGSIADNIALFDDIVDPEQIGLAAHAAALQNDIAQLPMGYDSLIGDMGSSLSGGQRQRLLLARALYRRPRLLAIDEATSHLDATLEQQILDQLDSLAVTRIVIAHRSAAIAAAHKRFLVTGCKLITLPTTGDEERAMAPASSSRTRGV